MEKTVELVFITAANSHFTISIPSPLETLTLAAAHAVMDTIIAKNVFSTTGGDLTDIYAARIHTSSTVELA